MKTKLIATALLSMTTLCYGVSYDDATQLKPDQALTHDIILVPYQDIAKYCNFNKTIIKVDGYKKGKTDYYECKYIGEQRKTRK